MVLTSGEKYKQLNWKSDMSEDKMMHIKNGYELFQKYDNVKRICKSTYR